MHSILHMQNMQQLFTNLMLFFLFSFSLVMNKCFCPTGGRNKLTAVLGTSFFAKQLCS